MFNIAYRLSTELSDAEAHALMGLVLANFPHDGPGDSRAELDALQALRLVQCANGVFRPTEMGKMVAYVRFSAGPSTAPSSRTHR